jgi:Cu(I)/Ag(I) efflux system membrane protein CusA/SilA
VDAEIVMIEASHKKLEHAPPGADRHALLAEAAREVTPALFFSLLIIAVAFLPVFTLTGQAGRLFTPLAWTKTFVMLSAAILSITFAPALRDLLIRGRIRPESEHPVSRFIIRLYKPFVFVALRHPKSTVAMGLLAVLSAIPLAWKLGSEFMPPLNEGDLLYMPTTFPGLSIEEARRQLQLQDRILRSVPEVETVFGKVGRAETATDPAPLTMVETTVRLKPKEQWRKGLTWDALMEELNGKMQIPGWTNAFTMPIKGRVDMLSTGVRTPVGVKVMGASLLEIEKIGVELERLLRPIVGTRSVFYERNTGGLYLDILPDREALARYGLTVGDLNRVVEAAIGGAPIGTTVDGRNRFSINVRYPQDQRNDVEQLRRLLVPVGSGGRTGGGMGGGATGAPPPGRMAEAQPAQNMSVMGAPGPGTPGPGKPSSGNPLGISSANASATDPSAQGWGGGGVVASGGTFVPLGQVAEVRIAGGPPMIRDDGGLLVGFVYVDLDGDRDVGGYVEEAKELVRRAQGDGRLVMPTGYLLKWTGQYELMAKMAERMRLVVPLTLLLIVLLLYAHFRNFTEVLIVLLSIPFAMVGSVWLMWALDYHLSTAVWIGIIALVGLAAQTGIVMIVYIDNAFERRRAAGKIRDLSDIIWAHMEGTVQRVRPKLMTVATMLAGLIPLLWATGSGADVMKRIAAPMVGGLLTSAFLTLEIIPVVYTYWRQEQLLWDRLAPLDPVLLARLSRLALVQKAGWFALAGAGAAAFYVPAPAWILWAAAVGALAAALGGLAAYLRARLEASGRVWPVVARPAPGPSTA